MTTGMAGDPHVTICVPAFNAARTLARTLDSLLAQDYGDLEVLVCDNLSTDGTAQIAGRYASRGIQYVLNPTPCRWGEENWNHALSLAQGPLIALYHADDIYKPTMVRRQVEFLVRHPEVCSVFTMTERIDLEDRPIRLGTTRLPAELRGRSVFGFEELLNSILRHGDFICTPTMMTRVETLRAVGSFSPEIFASAADLDLWLRMARWRPVGIIDDPLHRYRVHPHQGSQVMERDRTHPAHFFKVIDSYLKLPEVAGIVEPQALRVYELARATDLVHCAMNALASGETDLGRRYLSRAMAWRHMVTALERPRALGKMLVGLGLMIATRLGTGQACARSLDRLYQARLRHLRQPLAG